MNDLHVTLAGQPFDHLVTDFILLRTIWMCLTGRVTWRGTSYGADTTRKEHHSATTEPTESSKVVS